MKKWVFFILVAFVGWFGAWGRLGINARTANAAGVTVQFSFMTETAAHAALGVPIRWTMFIMNTGTAKATLTKVINLVAPDSTTIPLYNRSITYAVGGSETTAQDLTTSTFTSQTGTFQLVGQILSGATVVSSQTVPITITSAPVNGIYVSVGGVGPANAAFGLPTIYKTVTANLATSAMSLTNNVYLQMPDGVIQTLSLGKATSYAAGANSGTGVQTNINASVWPNAGPGDYTVTVNVLDSSKNILATDSYVFTRNALPASKYVPTFTDSTLAAGITFDRGPMMDLPKNCGKGNSDYMTGGSGVAVGDVNGDGYDDIFFIDMMGMGTLYRNNGDGTFTDITISAGIPMLMDQSAAIFGDVDNDGNTDLLILTNNMSAMSPPMLLKNNGPNAMGDVTFTDVTATSGINVGPTQNLTGGTFGDYDSDGLLDLYITVHVDCNTQNSNHHLFHNNGNGNFSDVTHLIGGSTDPRNNRRGLVTVFFDYNNDGKVDLYVGQDVGGTFGANVLWRNNGSDGMGGWRFADISATTKAGQPISDMGIAVGDFNRDGLFDLYLTNVGCNPLMMMQASGSYNQVQWENVTHTARCNVPSYTTAGMAPGVLWGTALYDFNNDGWEDLFAAGGATKKGTDWSAFFLSNQDSTFLDISTLTGTLGKGSTQIMPTAVFTDYNNDGFMDILSASMVGKPQLYLNNARSNGNPYNWLQVKLVGRCMSAAGCMGTASNRDAIGARIVAMVGGANLSRQVIDGATYQGNSTLVQQFGLGSATQVDTLTVYWPSGQTTMMSNILANQKITITEP